MTSPELFHRYARYGLCLVAFLSILAKFAAGQVGVVKADPESRTDPHCQLYISPKLILAFSLDLKNRPFLNLLNFTEDELALDATNISVRLSDERLVHPSVLKIETALQGDMLYRSYLTIHPKSSFYVELDGLADCLATIDVMEIQLGAYIYRLEKIRKEAYDVLLDRIGQLSTSADSPARDFRRLSIPLKGTRYRQQE